MDECRRPSVELTAGAGGKTASGSTTTGNLVNSASSATVSSASGGGSGSAGANQSVDDPLGVRGEELHEWVTVTRFFHEMTGEGGGC